MIRLDWCPDCGGSGHYQCKCNSGMSFVIGCCKRCAGEGKVSQPKSKEIILTDQGHI